MISFELIPLVAAAVNLAVTLFVLSRNVRAIVNWVYLLWGVSLTLWNVGVFMLFRVEIHEDALWWARLLQVGVVFLPVSLLHLCLLVTQSRMPPVLPVFYALHGLLAGSALTGWFVRDVQHLGYAYYTVGGPLYWVFVGSYSVIAAYTTWLLYQKQRVLRPPHRNRVRTLLWANGVLIVFGTNDLLPILGREHYPGTGWDVYPLGSAGALFYGVMVAYGALQHELLNVRVTLSRATAWLVRLAFTFLVGLGVMSAAALLLPQSFTPVAFGSALLAMLVSASVAAVCFPRLFGRGEDTLVRWVLADQFELRDRLQGFIQEMGQYHDADTLLQAVEDVLTRWLGVARYTLLLAQDTTRSFAVVRSFPRAEPLALTLRADGPLGTLLRQESTVYLAFNIAYALPGQTEAEKAAGAELQAWAPEFCFPLRAGGDVYGMLLLGGKTQDRLYSPLELGLVTELVGRLAVVLDQIHLRNQVLLAKEFELLGRMSRGMAHDLNNLITPILTYLQLSQVGALQPEDQAEALPLALRNLETIRTYIREALFFSEQRAPQFCRLELQPLVERAVELTATRAKHRGVRVTSRVPAGLLADLDEVLLLRLLTNLIANAIDASLPGGDVEVLVEAAATTGSGVPAEWLRFRVVDRGEGMSDEHLERASTPYFTTKDRGDGQRGFGLGLAICRKITHLHGGQMTIASREREGTTVQVDLPGRRRGPGNGLSNGLSHGSGLAAAPRGRSA